VPGRDTDCDRISCRTWAQESRAEDQARDVLTPAGVWLELSGLGSLFEKSERNCVGRVAKAASSSVAESGDQTTRSVIVDAAARQFARWGYDATTNKMIAVAAGVAPGLIYHYFDSKLDLYAAVYSQITQHRYERSRTVLASGETLAGKIRALAKDLVKMWETDPTYVEFHARTLYETQHEEALKESLRVARRETERLWEGIVEEAKATHDMPADVPTQAIVDACLSWSTGLVMRLPIYGGKRTLAATEVFASGIEAHSKRAGGTVK
jgi:AcrR family transcriptional regulator